MSPGAKHFSWYYVMLGLSILAGGYSLVVGLKWKIRLFIGFGIFLICVTLLLYWLGSYFGIW